MHRIPPTEAWKELDAHVFFPSSGFTPDDSNRHLFTFTGDLQTSEAKNLVRYYTNEMWPSINQRAISQGLRIDKNMVIGPNIHCLRGSFIENNDENTTVIFLIVKTPSQAQPIDLHSSPIDWTVEPYVDKRAAVGKDKKSKPEPIDVESGMILQLDAQEVLYANPKMEGLCMLTVGHNYETIAKCRLSNFK